MQKSVRLLLVDDHKIVLDSLALLFSSMENIEVVGKLTKPQEVLQFIENQLVDVLISDLQMPEMSGIDLTLQLRNRFPLLKIILLTMVEDAHNIREAIRAGVNGYVLKTTGREELEKAISVVMDGKKFYSEDVISELASEEIEELIAKKPENVSQLTSREIEVLRLIVEELSSNEIAQKLFISLPTVESHRRNLMTKLKVKSSIGMVKYALRHGL